jgi:hypothetical protein
VVRDDVAKFNEKLVQMPNDAAVGAAAAAAAAAVQP